MKQLYREMASLASKGESFVLATVIARDGSAPRAMGAKMLVRQDGSTVGTVGGGMMEARVEKLAKEVQREHHSISRRFMFHGKNATINEPICGGEVEVLVEWLNVNDSTLAELLITLNAAVTENKKAWWVTALAGDKNGSNHSLVLKDGRISGILPSGLSPENVIETRQPARVQLDQEYFVDPLENSGTVYIFGAGHVSRSLADFTKAAGFWTVVLDDRAILVNHERFPGADQLIVLEAFSDAISRIEVDRDSFLVIVTRGHLHDQTVLVQALSTPAGYIGMMGSRRKCGLVFDDLRRQGFSEDDIRRIHAPIGLSIEAETPEEIGISIVAELIQMRAKMRKQAAQPLDIKIDQNINI